MRISLRSFASCSPALHALHSYAGRTRGFAGRSAALCGVGLLLTVSACATVEDPISIGAGAAAPGRGGSSYGGSSGSTAQPNASGGAMPAAGAGGGAPTASGGASTALGGAGGRRGGSSGAAGEGGRAPATAGGRASSGGRSSSSGGASSSTGGKADGTCDWEDAACMACAEACPTNDGGTCAKQCSGIITCVQGSPGCGTPSDPMCVKRNPTSGQANKCTNAWDQAGGSSVTPNSPAQRAIAYFECACGTMVP